MTAGHRHLLDLGAGGLERLGRGLRPGGHVGRDALGVEQLLHHADAQAVDAVVEVVEHRRRPARGSTWSRPGRARRSPRSSAAASATVAANGPIWSRLDAKATSP